MTDPVYQKFVKRWEKVTDLPVQNLGPLTPLYKTLVKKLKVMPWPALVLGSALLVLAFYFAVGGAVSFFVSILQRGF